MGFFFNISATAEASEFKFGVQLGLAKPHQKIKPRGKSGRGPGLGELPEIGDFRLIFLQRLKLATSKLAGWWGLRRPILNPPEEKVGVALARGAPKNVGFFL